MLVSRAIGLPRFARDVRKNLARRLQRRSRATAFYLDAGDAAAFHLQHGVAAAVVIESLPAVGNLAQLRHDQATQGLKTPVARKRDVIVDFEVSHVGGTIEHRSTRSQ